jgi:hypothetical protein
MEYYLKAKIVGINIRSKSRESNYKKEIVGLRVSGFRGLRASGFEELVGLGLVGLGLVGLGLVGLGVI